MAALDRNQLKEQIIAKFGPQMILSEEPNGLQPFWEVYPDRIDELCLWLRDHSDYYFDYLACLSGVDTIQAFQVVYHLHSIPNNYALVLKVTLDREAPTVPSVSGVWGAANWHEREAFDFYGIHFEGHPDLRRILLPEDWEGYPLRKDYQTAEEYKGIKIDY